MAFSLLHRQIKFHWVYLPYFLSHSKLIPNLGLMGRRVISTDMQVPLWYADWASSRCISTSDTSIFLFFLSFEMPPYSFPQGTLVYTLTSTAQGFLSMSLPAFVVICFPDNGHSGWGFHFPDGEGYQALFFKYSLPFSFLPLNTIYTVHWPICWLNKDITKKKTVYQFPSWI